MIKVKPHSFMCGTANCRSCVEPLIVLDLVCRASYHTRAALSCDMRPYKQTRSDTISSSSHAPGFPIVYRTEETHLSWFSEPPEQCEGGKEWVECSSPCVPKCHSQSEQCRDLPEAMCAPGCACPPERPVWHRQRCIRMEQCPRECYYDLQI